MLEFLTNAANNAANSASLNICDDGHIWIIQVIKVAIRIICLAAPFALIIFGSLDFFKAIIAGDEKEMKAKRKPFIGRLVSAIIVLLMPTIINIVMQVVSKNFQNTFAKCWNDAGSDWTINLPNYDSYELPTDTVK